mmetsp:Transcript_20847/g.62204  ORF Transcript_20847/g.62204 Transcript_20847/m.62204 type:complete len:271 (+) Transcript_20847:1459-2271(+)
MAKSDTSGATMLRMRNMVVMETLRSTAWMSVAKRFCTRPTGLASNQAVGFLRTLQARSLWIFREARRAPVFWQRIASAVCATKTAVHTRYSEGPPPCSGRAPPSMRAIQSVSAEACTYLMGCCTMKSEEPAAKKQPAAERYSRKFLTSGAPFWRFSSSTSRASPPGFLASAASGAFGAGAFEPEASGSASSSRRAPASASRARAAGAPEKATVPSARSRTTRSAAGRHRDTWCVASTTVLPLATSSSRTARRSRCSPTWASTALRGSSRR